MTWYATITSIEQGKMTSTMATAIYGLLSCRTSFTDFWELELEPETIPA